MNFLIADSFTNALAKLQHQEQKAAKITVFDLQQDPAAPGLKFHRIDKSKDPNFWSIRVNSDIRIVIHKTAASFLVAYVGHHDAAYTWAERRRIETHPKTGAAQIVEVRERVEEIALPSSHAPPEPSEEQHPLFWATSSEDLLGVGVPEDWLDDVKAATEDRFLELIDHLPSEAAEALWAYTVNGAFAVPEIVSSATGFDHPDALRRFRILDDKEELERALDYPWEKWTIFLHPSQRKLVQQNFNGPARVSGSAGTGKTVVALHRAAEVVRRDVNAKVLLTTFSEPLANHLSQKMGLLVTGNELQRITIRSFIGAARDLAILSGVFRGRILTTTEVDEAVAKSVASTGIDDVSDRFILSEWKTVIDPWQLDSLEEYANVPRLGRRSRLGAKQRERLWPIFEDIRSKLRARGLMTEADVFASVTEKFLEADASSFTHIVVDEAQDLGVPELRMLAALSGAGSSELFFAGDLGQRIFKEPFSWKSLGVDVRGRSKTLKVNYRTSHQIRSAADGLLPTELRDVDGNTEERSGTVSVFNSGHPERRLFADEESENSAITSWIEGLINEGVEPQEIGIFVRSFEELSRARVSVKQAGFTPLELSERLEDRSGRIAIGTMHLAKGLEFKAVAVMACDDAVLPLQSRIETAGDQATLDDYYDTERSLFYVACTRARDHLLVSGVKPGSVFFDDLNL